MCININVMFLCRPLTILPNSLCKKHERRIDRSVHNIITTGLRRSKNRILLAGKTNV